MAGRDVRRTDVADYDYPLPESRIARHPCGRRDACRLLVSRPGEATAHRRFSDLAGLLPADALLVRNNTRVINARLRMAKPTGATVEIFLLDPLRPAAYEQVFAATESCDWTAIVGNLKRWKEGGVYLDDGAGLRLRAERLGDADGAGHVPVRLSWQPAGEPFAAVLPRVGSIPIPPYLNRESEESDATDYQTVYSRVSGSVAAPTAGLHFTEESFERLRAAGVEVADVTLHVGAGTFAPVKSADIGGHPMHTEPFTVGRRLVARLLEAVETGRPVIAVGTTAVRTLESLPLLGLHVLRGEAPERVEQWEAYSPEATEADTAACLRALLAWLDARGMESLTASTAILIAPGFRWRVVGGMVTNFHQPRSTLLLLVASFLERPEAGNPRSWRALYDEALARDYRFLSYGDGMLLL